MSRNELTWQEKLAAAMGGLPAGDTAGTQAGTDSEKTGRTTPARVDVVLERKGRGGKTATIVTGLESLADSELLALASKMKTKLGAGGSARGGEILIQGDRRDDVVRFLSEAGYRARKI